MKRRYFFWAVAILLASCQNKPEEQMDVDELVLAEDEFSLSAHRGEPYESPQEVLMTPENFSRR